MTLAVQFHPEADAEFIAGADWYDERERGLGRRFLRAVCASVDAAALLREGALAIDAKGTGLVLVRDLAVTTMCPHHLLPAHGTATVAYLPGARVAGIGTLAHVVDVLAHRLTLQERIGDEVVALIVSELGARGALCRLALTHSCLIARGERKTGSIVETLAVAGSFAEATPDRDLAFLALGSGGRLG